VLTLILSVRPVFVDFPDIFELSPDFGGFEVVVRRGEGPEDVPVPPAFADIPGSDHFPSFGDSPVDAQRPDDEVAEGDDRPDSQQQDTKQ